MDKEKVDREIVRLVLKLSQTDNIDDIAKLVKAVDTLIDVRNRLYPEEEETIPTWKRIASNISAWGLLINLILGLGAINQERSGIILSKLWPKVNFYRT